MGGRKISQKQLARHLKVSDSYVSQVLNRKKSLPDPDRSDFYSLTEQFLELPEGELARASRIERHEQAVKAIGVHPEARYPRARTLLLAKCDASVNEELQALFKTHSFGVLESLVTAKLIFLCQSVIRRHIHDPLWIARMAALCSCSEDETRTLCSDFLDDSIIQSASDGGLFILDALLTSWQIDTATLHLDIVLNATLVDDSRRTFDYVESNTAHEEKDHPIFLEFQADKQYAADITPAEVALLRLHRFGDRQPTKLYFYRALQNLRDSLNFIH